MNEYIVLYKEANSPQIYETSVTANNFNEAIDYVREDLNTCLVCFPYGCYEIIEIYVCYEEGFRIVNNSFIERKNPWVLTTMEGKELGRFGTLKSAKAHAEALRH